MSKYNKVNPDHYKTGGRLTPDEMARQRFLQGTLRVGGGRRRREKPMPPWLANEQPGGGGRGGGAADTARGEESQAGDGGQSEQVERG